ncbi:DUF4097 family beta strand repeat-containing protein [Clostridium aquiflavi]|uniref:DUF4097 family beta strand repeat-containing protein n=1 Tax=Clostridium aquiflavi TaxID=3073603 RepID=A0ABU1EFB3_9CLOT|nr:DUF4097 family beta strand repeat-containing protein [Clostridium sp. 5N-1]MDR5587076.1 DUF4097 family beta strand repeat-containing protein [Clostridium sp. 5N-1]
MVRTKKKLLICSICMIGVGLILAVIGFSMGGKFGIIRDKSGYKILDKEDGIVKIEASSDFKSIEINSTVDKIDIIKSYKYGIEIEYNSNENDVNYSIKDGKLVIQGNKSQDTFNNISFGIGNTHIPSYIKVYVPDAADLDTINVKSSNTKITMNSINANEISINCNYGEIKSNNLIANGLKIASNNSDIDLDGEFKGVTSISSHYGDINLRTNISKELYNYSTSCDYGDINIDGDKFTNKVEKNGNNNAQHSIDITSNNGDINVNFK